VREEILQRKWRWLRHTFRKTTTSVTRHGIHREREEEVDQKNHMATKCGIRDKENEPIMGMVGTTSPGQRCLEGSCGWPMYQ
jgi:hypothetical protein